MCTRSRSRGSVCPPELSQRRVCRGVGVRHTAPSRSVIEAFSAMVVPLPVSSVLPRVSSVTEAPKGAHDFLEAAVNVSKLEENQNEGSGDEILNCAEDSLETWEGGSGKVEESGEQGDPFNLRRIDEVRLEEGKEKNGLEVDEEEVTPLLSVIESPSPVNTQDPIIGHNIHPLVVVPKSPGAVSTLVLNPTTTRTLIEHSRVLDSTTTHTPIEHSRVPGPAWGDDVWTRAGRGKRLHQMLSMVHQTSTVGRVEGGSVAHDKFGKAVVERAEECSMLQQSVGNEGDSEPVVLQENVSLDFTPSLSPQPKLQILHQNGGSIESEGRRAGRSAQKKLPRSRKSKNRVSLAIQFQTPAYTSTSRESTPAAQHLPSTNRENYSANTTTYSRTATQVHTPTTAHTTALIHAPLSIPVPPQELTHISEVPPLVQNTPATKYIVPSSIPSNPTHRSTPSPVPKYYTTATSNATTSPVRKLSNITRTPNATTSPVQKCATTSPVQKCATTSPVQTRATTSPVQKCATTSPVPKHTATGTTNATTSPVAPSMPPSVVGKKDADTLSSDDDQDFIDRETGRTATDLERSIGAYQRIIHRNMIELKRLQRKNKVMSEGLAQDLAEQCCMEGMEEGALEEPDPHSLLVLDQLIRLQAQFVSKSEALEQRIVANELLLKAGSKQYSQDKLSLMELKLEIEAFESEEKLSLSRLESQVLQAKAELIV